MAIVSARNFLLAERSRKPEIGEIHGGERGLLMTPFHSIPAGAGETTTSTFSLPAELIGIGEVVFRVVPN